MPTSAAKIKDYRDLQVWQRAIALVESIYRATQSFPKAELGSLTDQLRRAAVSIPSNIAEGHARSSTREYLHHLSIARGSLAEVETQIEIARRLSYLEPHAVNQLLEAAAILGRQLNALRSSLQSAAKPAP